MATTPGGLVYPVTTDAFDPSGDIEKLARSADAGRIVTVPSPTVRDALAAATTIRPLYVHRTDAGSGRELERTADGKTWLTIPVDQQGSGGAVTLGAGWSAVVGQQNVPRVVRDGAKRTLYGAISAGTGFSATSVLTVHIDDRPPSAGTRGLGLVGTSAGGIFEVFMTGGVLGFIAGYGAGAIAVGQAVQLGGLSWWMD